MSRRNRPHPLRYARRHWRGELSLPIALGVNCLLLGGLLYFLESGVHGLLPAYPRAGLAVAIGYFLVLRLVVYPWLAVGLLRSCERTLHSFGGNVVLARAAQGAFLASLVVVFVDLLGMVHAVTTFLRPPEAALDSAGGYTLEVVEGGTAAHLQGELAFGVTRDLDRLLEENPRVSEMILDSAGGQIYEGRGLAMLIGKHRLSTSSRSGCYSACILAFASGARRSLGPGARLGFHRYRLEASYVLPFVDVQREMKRDLDFLASRGIQPDFLSQVDATASDEMWFPTPQELIDSGFAHEIAREPYVTR